MRIILLNIIFILFLSCATYQNRYTKKDKLVLTENNIKNLSGKYSMITNVEYNKKGEKENMSSEMGKRNTYQQITGKFIIIDTLSNYSVEIKNEIDNINFDFYKDNEKFESVSIKGELKTDGLFYLDNTKTKCWGVPYLFGGCDQEKTRIGITMNGDLMINKAIDTGGAFLFIIGNGYSYNSCYSFNRIE